MRFIAPMPEHQNKGGVHISKLAYEDLTWENSSDPESFAPWYTLGCPWSILCGQCLDPTLGKFPPLYGPHLGTPTIHFPDVPAEDALWCNEFHFYEFYRFKPTDIFIRLAYFAG